MAIRIRTTEKHPHPIWEKLIAEFPISEIQGFIFTCTDEELIKATKESDASIPIICIEAAEYDSPEELILENVFLLQDWVNKIHTATFFKAPLLFLTHCPKEDLLFRLHQVFLDGGVVTIKEINQFKVEASFIEWWATVKKLSQTKKTVEARPRQGLTVFDNIIEKNGYSWGGNMDGFVLTDKDNSVRAIIEVRQSRTFPIEKYDPANYFLGTFRKGGDFKTWLPLVYLKKAYKIPIILLTLSTKSGSRFGFTEVRSINDTKLFYVDDIPPNKNISDDFEVLKNWIIKLTVDQ